MAPAEPHILGQRLAVAALAKAIGSGRLHHAWILHGPAGVGKFRVAEALARIHLDPLAGDAHRAALEPPAGTPTQALRKWRQSWWACQNAVIATVSPVGLRCTRCC